MSRWREGAGDGSQRRPTPKAAADRVVRVHAQARTTVRLALAAIALAALATALDASSWLALHLFLAGGVVLAISGVSQMLTVTWSAAPAPPDWVAALQRTCIVAGVVGIVAWDVFDLATAAVVAAASVYLTGLALLAGVLIVAVRRGVERRFDPAVGAYVAAIGAGIAGVAIGASMGAGTTSAELRAAHLTLNLLGLVGLVIGGTLPYFAATVGRTRMARRATAARLATATAWLTVALAVAVAGLLAGSRGVAATGLLAYGAGIGLVAWLLPTPTRRQLRWSGPRLVALWAGAAWWAVAVIATGVGVLAGTQPVWDPRWLPVLVIAGYAQILWGSLAYLLPVLRGGGHERLGAGFATTRSWLGLAMANLAGAAFVAELPVAGGFAIAVWLVDAAIGAARVRV